MVLDGALEELEPEERQIRQHRALMRDAGRQDAVERADAVGGDDEQRFVKLIKVAHFAPVDAPEAGQVGFEYYGRGHSSSPWIEVLPLRAGLYQRRARLTNRARARPRCRPRTGVTERPRTRTTTRDEYD